MKIDSFTPSTDLHSTQVDKAQQTESVRSQRTDRAALGKDSAAISGLAQQIAQSLEQPSPEEVARVSEAQKLYQSGGFNLPAGEVADSLIRSAVDDTSLFSELEVPSSES